MLTDSRVDDGEGVVGLVGNDVDVELRVGLQEVLIRVLQVLELDLVEGIARVGDQLSQEDFLLSSSGRGEACFSNFLLSEIRNTAFQPVQT